MIDVGIIGGGAAGLQAALTLGRACRSVLVFDDGRQRNRSAAVLRGFLGTSAAPPAAVVANGWTALADYDVDRVSSRVLEVRGNAEDGFELSTADSSYAVRVVILASGLDDTLPAIPGVAELWGRGVVACPHCHGWEVRGRPLAQLTHPGRPADRGVERAVLLSRWSRHVTFFSGGAALSRPQRDRLDAAGVSVEPAPVLGVRSLVDDTFVVDADPTTGAKDHGSATASPPSAFAAVFVTVEQHQQTALATALGCATGSEGRDAGAVKVDHHGRTSVPGVFAAGSTAVPSLLAVGAAGHASSVATAVHTHLIELELAPTLGADPSRHR